MIEVCEQLYFTELYCDGAATLHLWRGGAAQLSTILETAVLWRLQLYLNFGRKVVADFSTRKIANVGAKTAATPKKTKADPKHKVAQPPIATTCTPCTLFFDPFRVPPSVRRIEISPYCFVLLSNTLENMLVWAHQSFRPKIGSLERAS
jgi:hypothetical protein